MIECFLCNLNIKLIFRYVNRWAWLYLPQNLPRAYQKWIEEAAQVDRRLILALRYAREGTFVYGENNEVLQGICQDHRLPMSWSNPKYSIPIPCEVIHAGRGPSCHWHAASRFLCSFRFSLLMYLPLQILIKMRRPSIAGFQRAFSDALRSSAFLAAFISTFYYSVCLARSILGPSLVRRNVVTPQALDSGICAATGCVLCGWSVLLEHPKRRSELAFFVAPRALSIFLPRKYNRTKICTSPVIVKTQPLTSIVPLEGTAGFLVERHNVVSIR